MTELGFTEQMDVYVVLVLDLSEYSGSSRVLPEGFELAGSERHEAMRQQEKKLLQEKFDDWEIPYCARLRGWRDDSPIYVASGDKLVGGVYLCDQNEFDAVPMRGQLHYAFMDAQFQGLGIYSVIFREAVRRADAWGLKELYLNSDRFMLPQVYMRWGAKPWKEIRKPSRWPRAGLGQFFRTARRAMRNMWQTMFSPCK